MRIGDNVRVDNFEGIVTDIKTRYTVIRSLAGRESIVPNEMIITSRVENLSLADPRVWASTVVSVAYDSDVDQVMRLLLEAALRCERVLREPGPSVALSNFGADGLNSPWATGLPIHRTPIGAALADQRRHLADFARASH